MVGFDEEHGKDSGYCRHYLAHLPPLLKLHPSLLMWLWLEKVAKKWVKRPVILLSYSGPSYQA